MKGLSPRQSESEICSGGDLRSIMEHRFYTLDGFTNSRFQGNPLAVFTDGDALSDDQMLAIARQINLSETVFRQKPTEQEALARLRTFTPKEHIKLTGHP